MTIWRAWNFFPRLWPGVQVLTAEKPVDGLALISLYRPQIVITDLVMPGMTGLDVLRRVKQFDPAI